MKVVVVGGGVAGLAAATAAQKSGAETTLLEGSDRLGLNRSLFPELLSRPLEPGALALADPERLSDSGVEVRLNERVERVDPQASLVRTQGGHFRFDSLVLATGSYPLPEEVRGISKQGVLTMRSAADYAALSGSMDDVSSFAVLGSAPLSLLVADALSRRSRVRVFLGSQGLPFSGPIRGSILGAASARGVEITSAGIDAIAGTKRVEAVVSAGLVYPSDGVVVLPRSSPLVPESGCLKGDHGGVLVDRSMRTSSRSVFAAGDCAELRLGRTSMPLRLHSSSAVMGEVAGVNAAGGAAETHLARSMAFRAFGLEVCAAGLDVSEGEMAGLRTIDAEFPEQELRVTLVWDQSTRKVRGVQAAGPGALSLSESASLAVSCGVRLEDLAYHDSPYSPRFNTDRPPIRLTAGKALTRTRERPFEAQGTHQRPG